MSSLLSHDNNDVRQRGRPPTETAGRENKVKMTLARWWRAWKLATGPPPILRQTLEATLSTFRHDNRLRIFTMNMISSDVRQNSWIFAEGPHLDEAAFTTNWLLDALEADRLLKQCYLEDAEFRFRARQLQGTSAVE